MSELNEKILDKVKECLFQALGVEKQEITPESSLTRDLGAESIDFLDIIFRLEQAFSIKIPRGDLFPEHFLNSSEFVQNGKVTEAGLKELRQRFPFTNFDQYSANPLVSKLTDTFTVRSLTGYLSDRLSAGKLNKV